MCILDEAKKFSNTKLKSLKDAVNQKVIREDICIFTCGSLGRLEITQNSDLDLFFVLMNTEEGEENSISNLEKYLFFSDIYQINKVMGFKDPSKGGLYWDFITEKQLLDIGSRVEDYNNSFTARMLLLLEGKPLNNEDIFRKLKKHVINKYFEEYLNHVNNFYPLFLMNDILRYWYTLTLNYEYRRDSKDDKNEKYWKRLELKYARFLTCLSLIMCLFKKKLTKEDVCVFSDMTPLERIEYLHENYEDISDGDYLKKIKSKYELYLGLRKKDPGWWNEGNNKTEAFKNADEFHQLLKEMLYVIARTNPELVEKMDLILSEKVIS